ncbi:hypothetical protein SteCoe_25713 [Stentor coeruleus]|uniref:Condensin complex subunit 1 C-terminal domain-containing protein n=1 Tax=Stentor coeruleus TaxID=5963 RepID=A0A1R2BES2_9CILI|nr:hypothetical protein SteCoe_25713 [Stentor coeruleus]
MTTERLVNLFNDSLKKRSRDRDAVISTVCGEYFVNPQVVYDFVIVILQNTFRRKKLIGHYTSSNLANDIFKLISRILGSLANQTKSSNQRKKLIDTIADYIKQCSKSINKFDRGGVIDFLVAFKTFEFADFAPLDAVVKEVVKILIVDKSHYIRGGALKLANCYSMKQEILLAVQSDPTPVIRKRAIDLLQLEDRYSALQSISKSLDDSSINVRLQAIMYYLRTNTMPDSQGLQKLFILMGTDPNNLIRSKSREVLFKLTKSFGYKSICSSIDLSGQNRISTESQHYLLSGLYDLLKSHTQDALDLLNTLLPNLIQQKEKTNIADLFLIRLSISICKSSFISLFPTIETFNLQTHLPILLDFFMQNTEEVFADYYFKLQNIILISFIDIEEHCREMIINKYLQICKDIPLHRFYKQKYSEEIDNELVKGYIEKFNDGFINFASNEEDVISTVVCIIREIYKDAEMHFLLRLKHELLDPVINGVMAEETENYGIKAPLQLKLEKTEKKIKQNEENRIMLRQSLKDKKINHIEIEDYDENKLKLETKKLKIMTKVLEKNYRGLMIYSHCVKQAEFAENVHPEYVNYAQNFIKPEIESTNLYISSLALNCLGYFCLLSNSAQVAGPDGYYMDFLGYFKNVREIKSIISVLFIFDMIMIRKLNFEGIMDECIRWLYMNFKDERESIRLITLEGFCKLLLKRIISDRVPYLYSILKTYFDPNMPGSNLSICQAFIENYINISEELTLELANAYLIYIFINRKDQSGKKNSAMKSDDKLFEIATLFSPEIEKTYQKTENIQLLIFVFCYNYFSQNKKFFMKIILKLSIEKFDQDMEKFVRNRLENLKNKHGSMAKDIDKCLKKLPQGREIVEDITYREYDLRINDIEALAELILREF